MKVSIITPTLNPDIKYLDACIESVLNQRQDIEHIFMDGGSTKGTIERLRFYQEMYPTRIRFITGKDKSAGDAWVKGLRHATGDILGWLGADDTLEPNAIKTVVDYFTANPQSMFVFGGCNYIDANSKIIRQITPNDFDINEAINDHVSIPCTSAFYRKEVVKKVSPDIIAEQDSEIEYWLMVAEHYKLHRVNAVLSNFRIHDRDNRKDGFYINSKINYDVAKRHGAKFLSPVSLRYYLALLTRPLSPIIDPIFLYIVSGRR